MENEFKKFSIPVKWRKYFYIGLVSILLIVIKWLSAMVIDLQAELKKCNQGRVDNIIESNEVKRKSDSAMIHLLMKQALREADENIIQPKIDSIKADRS